MAKMHPTIFITQPIPDPALRRLQRIGQVTLNPDPTHILTKEEMIVGVRHHDILFCLLHDRVDREVMDANPHLSLIASMAPNPAGVDIAAATARKVPVTAVPHTMVTEATADLHWALLLCVARRMIEADRVLRSGTFPGSQSSYLVGGDVSGKTLGIVGCGRIGQAVARRAKGFRMRTLYCKRIRLEPALEEELCLEYLPLAEVLRQADFISINAALTPETHHLIGHEQLRSMKPTAYVINTARGPIVDEKALIEALRQGWIAGAALDVYEHEPEVEPALLELANVVLTPHIGSAAAENRIQMAETVVENILAVIAGRRPPDIVNPEIYT